MTTLVDRYIASMVLSGVGDAMGFKNADWEFCLSGADIHKQMENLGGIANLCIKRPKWRVSDDTVMHLATGDALVDHGLSEDKETLYLRTAAHYKDCMKDMQGRSPGITCRGCAYALQPQNPKGYQQPFDERGGGCGAAMRAMCIGLRYPREEDLDNLISYSVESGRMTHHHPTGYLGALAAALFTSYAVQNKSVKEWGAGLMSVLPKALQYVESQGRYVEENKQTWSYFTDRWTEYLKKRGIQNGVSIPKFPARYDVEERDKFYTSLSFKGWGGASGHDAPMIAYDALLGAGDSWEELCKRGMLHGGDNDSTGVMDGAWFGALYGFKGVSEHNYKNVEYGTRLAEMAVRLYELSHPDESVPESVIQSCGLEDIVEEWKSQHHEARGQATKKQNTEQEGESKNTVEQPSTEQQGEGGHTVQQQCTVHQGEGDVVKQQGDSGQMVEQPSPQHLGEGGHTVQQQSTVPQEEADLVVKQQGDQVVKQQQGEGDHMAEEQSAE